MRLAYSSWNESDDRGVTLIEIVVALGLTSVLAIGVFGLFLAAVRATALARHHTTMGVLAEQKLERLRALTWSVDSSNGVASSDTSSDLSADPPSNGGGGLQPSPVSSLAQDTNTYCDYLDAAGRWMAGGTTAPAGAAYVRRWRVRALPGYPDARVLDVLVTTIAHVRMAGGRGAGPPVWPVVVLSAVKVRRPT